MSQLQRNLLFLLGCVPIRVLFVYLSKYHQELLPYMSAIALVIAIGFMSIYLFGLRKTGAETFGDRIWWNNLRPFHSLMYFTFAYMAIYHKKNAWIPLAVDVTVGTTAFAVQRLVLNI